MKKIKLKEAFVKRVTELLNEEAGVFLNALTSPLPATVRVNTLKIGIEELKRKLSKKWEIEQPIAALPEAILIKSRLQPGELGKALEHRLGYYFVQDIASMMPVYVLDTKPGESVLDVCAAPGAKTTHIAALMENSGRIVANDISTARIRILKINLRRCGVRNATVMNFGGGALAKRFASEGIFFDKILFDAPCSSEGSFGIDPMLSRMWNLKLIKRMASLQKKIIGAVLQCLKPEGILVYSTCTFAPEENEAVIDYALKNFDIVVEKIVLPLKTREGITEWQGRNFNQEVKNCVRILPQDNNTKGFFIAKIRRLS